MVCVLPLLLKRNIGVLFGVLRGPRNEASIGDLGLICVEQRLILLYLTQCFVCVLCSLLLSFRRLPNMYFMTALAGHFVYAALLICIRCACIN
jgi:hypothetical protein